MSSLSLRLSRSSGAGRLTGARLSAIAALCAPVAAQTLTGRLVDAQGVGVAGVDIDLKAQGGGGDPTLSQDFTDANGFFTTSVTPAGTYRVEFIPPPPPASSSMYLRLDNIVVSGVTNLGVITLPQGVALTGRCVDSGGAPLAGVNLDIADAAGVDVDLVHDTTDPNGFFAVAAPGGALRVDFDSRPVVGPLVAPQRRTLNLSAPTTLPDVVHPPGFVLSSFVKRQSNNSPVVGLDVDVFDSATQLELYTPDDTTDALGFFDTVVPAGVFDIRFDAPAGSGLVSLELASRSVSATTFLGTQLLPPGFTLSGLVTSAAGVPQSGVDIDVHVVATGAPIYLSADNTNAAGQYSVVVPAGTYRVDYSPSYSVPLGATQVASLLVNANKVQNAVLPSCPFFATVGVGTPGLGGVTPQISASGGTPRPGNDGYTLHVSQGRGGAFAIVFYSLNPPSNPLPSPMQVQSPMTRRIVSLDGPIGVAGAGDASFSLPIPQDPFLAGNLLRAWFRIRDGAALSGLSSSNELRATICP